MLHTRFLAKKIQCRQILQVSTALENLLALSSANKVCEIARVDEYICDLAVLTLLRQHRAALVASATEQPSGAETEPDRQ